jgi:hypothetical protein
MSIKISTKEMKNNKGKVVETVYNITKKAKGKMLSFEEANALYKDYRESNTQFVVKAMTKMGWTTLKSIAYNEEELREYDDDYFTSSGGAKTRDTNEMFLGLQFVVHNV